MSINIIDEIITQPDNFVDTLNDPYKSALYIYYIGTSFLSSQRNEDAIRYFDKALELDPNYKDAWNNKGIALRNQGHYDQAIECYNKAIDIRS